jgi:beta-galactosidase
MKYSFLLLLTIICGPLLFAQARQMQTLNIGWQFVLNDQQDKASIEANKYWEKINLPHTWNAQDIMDDTVGYHQGVGWYRKELFIPSAYADKHLELFFEGACNQTTVFVNGKEAGKHIGAFTGFSINLDGKIVAGQTNDIIVKVDNGKYLQDSVPPYSGDFSMMGGIYRDVWLLATNKIHFSNAFNKDGVLFETPVVTAAKAEFVINTFFDENNLPAKGSVEYILKRDGRQVAQGSASITATANTLQLKGVLVNPKLWSPEFPHLYELHVLYKDENKQPVDEVVQQVGFKSVAISAKNEFLLNGKPYKLKGASRHQDYKDIGFALPNAMHVRDVELMKEMGCNFIRISHYPQDPVIYETCDRLGLIAWNEIPVVDKVVNNETFFKNSALMMHEMILQHFNHASIAIWGYHNEVRNIEAFTVEHAKMLNAIAKKLDANRLTAMAYESNTGAAYFSSPLFKEMLAIPDINGYNVYEGWYRGNYNNIDSFLDTLYALHPSKPILLSEYGAGSAINIHAYKPTIFDFSEEYKLAYHEAYVKAGNRKPWMIGFAIWNFIDFQRDGREDVSPNINNKGMVTTDRQPKDVFYFYKSQWSKQPFVYIAGKHWPRRIALVGSDRKFTIPVTAYSNQASLQLFHNGKAIGSKNSTTGKFVWTIQASDGNNQLVCKTADGKLTDVLNLQVELFDTTTFSSNVSWNQLNFNTGQTRSYFTDSKSLEQWMPDKPYSKGTWGYVNGQVWSSWPGSTAWDGAREGIHKPILNTANEPLFQTFVQGLSAWKADVPPGRYIVSILLCEPLTSNQRKNEERVFDIALNGESWQQQLNIEKEYGVQAAVVLDKTVEVENDEGIEVKFISSRGSTIMNGVRIRRL